MRHMLSLSFLMCILFVGSCAAIKSSTYDQTVTHWSSYKDVANWMSKNLQYDYNRKIKGWQARTPEQTFKLKSGVCQDGANFARDALNRISPDYHAKIVHIKNSLGPPHHWVTAFTMEGKLYIMDYAAGRKWASLMGVHGPYDSLREYEKFLQSLHLPNFELGSVHFADY